MAVKIDKLQCNGIKECEAVCPTEAIKFDADLGVAVCSIDICFSCFACIDACPSKAISPED